MPLSLLFGKPSWRVASFSHIFSIQGTRGFFLRHAPRCAASMRVLTCIHNGCCFFCLVCERDQEPENRLLCHGKMCCCSFWIYLFCWPTGGPRAFLSSSQYPTIPPTPNSTPSPTLLPSIHFVQVIAIVCCYTASRLCPWRLPNSSRIIATPCSLARFASHR